MSLTLRYSRTTEGPHYLGSVAVIYTEAIKLVICLGVQLLHCRRAPKLHGNGEGWRAEFIAQSRDILLHSLPMALPAALFVMQQVCPGQRAIHMLQMLCCRSALYTVATVAERASECTNCE